MNQENERLDVNALQNDESARETLKSADIILGYERISQEHYAIFFGTEQLKQIAANINNPSKPLKIVHVDFDPNTDELEYLCGAVKTLKGYHEYGNADA